MVYADLKDPQTLNKYGYVVGNPLTTTDPDGHCPDKKPCPVLSETPSAIISEIPAQVISDVTIGAGKAVANIGIGVNNFSNFFLNGDDPNYVVQPFEPSSKIQFISQHATEVLTLVAPLLSGFGPATVVTSSSRQTTAVAAGVGNTSAESASVRTFQTYTKTNATTGKVYVGRTSGTGTPRQNIARRDASHGYPREGFGPARLDRSSTNYAAIRGREQELIDMMRRLGNSAIKINGVSPANPNRTLYCQSCRIEFGGSRRR